MMGLNIRRLFIVALLALVTVAFYSVQNDVLGKTTGGGPTNGDDGSSGKSHDDGSHDDDSGSGHKKKPKKHWRTDGNANIDHDIHFLGTTDEADLVIKTNSDEKVRVTTDGNVGIGVTDPQGKLDVGERTDPVGGECPIGYTHVDDNEDGIIDLGECWRGVVVNDGQVGIGTISPTLTLDVNGRVRIRGFETAPFGSGWVLMTMDSLGNAMWQPVADDSPTNELQDLSSTALGTDRTINISDGTGTTISVADNDNSSTNEIQGLSSTALETERTINISGGGNGTTINIADNDNDSTNEYNTGMSFDGVNLSITDLGGTLTKDISSLQGTDDQHLTGASLTDKILTISIEDGNSTTVNLAPLQAGLDTTDDTWENGSGSVFTGTGKVGIGLSNPITLLHAFGATGNIAVDRSDLTNGFASFDLFNNNNASTGWSIQMRPGNNNLSFLDRSTGGGVRMTLDQGTGNVGIGTAIPAEKLDVNGNIRWGSAGAVLQTDQGASMELRGTGTPYLDFSNDAATDRDMRLQLTGNDSLLIEGGNVGIGNPSPVSELDVNGTVNATAYLGDGSGLSGVDTSATNELQDLGSTVSGTNRTITITDGADTTISVADNDNSPNNEIQNLTNSSSDTSRTINISGGTGTTIDVADNDNSDLNEIQTLSRQAGSNDVELSNGGGTVSVADNDNDPVNEIQDLSLSGNTLILTDDATSVDLSGIGDDNLGDHKATQNLSLMNFWLSGDGGSEGISIDSTGNVGIGTSTPGQLLHILGDENGNGIRQKLENTNTDANAAVVYEMKTYSTGAGSNAWIQFNRSNQKYWSLGVFNQDNTFRISPDSAPSASTALTINASGNVGVGIDTGLTDRLTVDGNIVPSDNDQFSLGTVGNVWKDVYVGSNSLNIGGTTLSNATGILHWGGLPLGIWSLNGTSAYYNDGNVGIGTDTPQGILDVLTSANGAVSGFPFSFTNTNTGGHGMLIAAGGPLVDHESFSINNQAGTRLFSVRGNGNVGIGTVTPNSELHIKGSDALLTVEAAGATSAQVKVVKPNQNTFAEYLMYTGSNLKWRMGFAGAEDDFYISDQNVPGNFFSIKRSNGNVGIGTSTPLQKLDVTGDINLNASTGGIRWLNASTIGMRRDGEFISILNESRIGHFLDSNSNQTNAYFAVFHDGATEATALELFRVQENGRVGIGTTSPSTNAEVFDDEYHSPTGIEGTITLSQPTVSSTGGPAIRFKQNSGGGIGSKITGITHNGGGDLVVSTTNAWGSMYERLRIDASGKVGIGTTTPSGTLDVSTASTTGSSNLLYLTRGSGFGGTYFKQFYTDVNNHGLSIGWASDRLTINHANGNVGIGTSTPGGLLGLGNSSTYLGISDNNLIFHDGSGIGTKTLSELASGSGLWSTTNNSDIYRTAGNVGIGTAAPAYDFDLRSNSVENQIHIASSNVDTGGYLMSSAPVNFFMSAAAALSTSGWIAKDTRAALIGLGPANDATISFYTNSGLTAGSSFSPSERMRINASGNVGIGTMSPLSSLHVQAPGNGWITVSTANNIVGSGQSDYGVLFSRAPTSTTGNEWDITSGYPNRLLRFRRFDPNNNNLIDHPLVIRHDNGNVGIGTTSPNEKLSIDGGHINLNHSSTPFMRFQRSGGEHGYVGSAGALFGSGTQTDFGIRAQTNLILGAGTAEKMRILTNGNVGIGTTNPTSKLFVEGTTTVRGASNGNSNNFYTDFGGPKNYIRGETVFDQGNVGIGLADPDAKLEVAGQIKITGGSPGLGKVLTSDASGLASWETAASGGLWSLSGSDAFYNSGNVGIGTTIPGAKLEVLGTAQISNGSGFAPKNNFMASGSLTIGALNSSYGGGTGWNTNTAGLLLETQTNTEIAVHDTPERLASLMYYEGDTKNQITIGRNMGWGTISKVSIQGNVGIGTASPSAKLDVQAGSAGGLTSLLVNGEDFNTGLIARLRRPNAAEADLTFFSVGIVDAVIASERNLRFDTSQSGQTVGTPRMMILDNGNVGVGTTSPNEKLEVNGNIFLQRGNKLKFGAVGSGEWITQEDSAPHGIQFFVASTEKMRIANNGNTGIGVANPQRTLHIKSSVFEGIRIEREGANAGAFIEFENGDNQLGGIGLGGNESIFIKTPQIGDGSAFIVENTGDVGIGTLTPNNKLDIGGITGHAGYGLAVNGGQFGAVIKASTTGLPLLVVNDVDQQLLRVDGNGDVKASGAILHSSDARLKKDIVEIPEALNLISSIRGVRYYWNEDLNRNTSRQVGVIAQDVEKVLPEAVHTDEDGFKSVSYSGLIGPMIEAIKELKSENDLVKSENSQLKEELATLTERQSSIEEMLLALSTDLPLEKLVKLGSFK